MSMHMIRGVQVHGNSKKKKSKSKRLKAAQAEHEAFLERMGVGNKKSDYRYEMPDYNTGPRMTSDKIAGNGTKKDAVQYTGNEIAGIVVTHKSNLMPVRKDNKKAFVDAAQMRRN
jgi:hypothetical protein